MSHRIKMRLSGTQEDLNGWLYLLKKLEQRRLIRILEQSQPYPNRGSSLLYRVYIDVELAIDELQ